MASVTYDFTGSTVAITGLGAHMAWSPAARYVTGTAFTIDAGFTIK